MSQALFDFQKVDIFGRSFIRAEGGDVFVYRLGQACYSCMVGNMGVVQEEITNQASARKNGVIPVYVSAYDADAMVQVGLSTDIVSLLQLLCLG